MLRLLGTSWPLRLIALSATLMVALGAIIAPSPFVFAQDEGDELAGDFTVSITLESVPQDIPDGATIVGRWRISFNEDGSYEGERLDLGVLVRGSYSVAEDRVTITDEEGIVSCSNANMQAGGSGGAATGTYRFELDTDGLTLIPEEEGCALRRVLLSTTQLVPFVACTTEPVDLTAAGNQSDDPGAREGLSPDDVIAVEEASPTPKPTDEPENASETTGTPEVEAESTASADEVQTTEEQIDALLSQMTACWATGEPERFLALWSEDFREEFLGEATAVDSLRAAMQVPVGWERAGDVRMNGDDQAEAVVRTTTLDEEEFTRFLFVLEDGVWKWGGPAADE